MKAVPAMRNSEIGMGGTPFVAEERGSLAPTLQPGESSNQ